MAAHAKQRTGTEKKEYQSDKGLLWPLIPIGKIIVTILNNRVDIHPLLEGGIVMKKGLAALLLVSLMVTSCSDSGDDASGSSATTETSTPTTTTAATPTTEAPEDTTETPEATAEAQEASWPVPLAYQDAIYDPVTDSILLTGGIRGPGSDFWETEEVWALDVTTNTFERRSDIPFSYGVVFPVAYDQESDTIVALQTPMDTPGPAETWLYDRTTDSWADSGSEQQPTAAIGAMMAYDAESDLIVAYSGFFTAGGNLAGETWVYDADTDTWTDMAPETRPRGVEYLSLVYDQQSDLIVLYGTPQRTAYRTLWTYDVDTNTWTELDITGGPEVPPASVKGFYHPPTDRIVYFGGLAPNGEPGTEASNEVWAYDVDSNAWTELAPNPITGVMFHTFTYVPTLDRAVVFGGGPIYFDDPSGNRLMIYDPVADTWEEVMPS